MQSVYQLQMNATFATAEERDKAYATLKSFIKDSASKTALFKAADLRTNEVALPEDPVAEKLI